MTIQGALSAATTQLAHCATPRLDAEVLLSAVLGCGRALLYGWPGRPLAEQQWRDFWSLVTRRAAGEPVAYLIGHREFWSLDLGVTSDTLIPRPETEHLVELALERIPRESPWTVADLGTGTGAIALAVASERPRCHVLAIDDSPATLAVAQLNARRLGIINVSFCRADWCHALARASVDAVLANPPYVAENDPHLSRGDVRFEPRRALAAGCDGLAALRLIAAQARTCLRPDRYLLLEHGHDQGPAVLRLLDELGYTELRDETDLAGAARVAVARRPD